MKDRKKSENDRKDFRRTMVPEEEISVSKPQNKKKDTKRWCKGKVGKEHITKCVMYNDVKRTNNGIFAHATRDWKLLICTVCGKEIDRFFPLSKKHSIPDWVK